MPRRANLVEPRVLLITALALVLGVGAGIIARVLVALIALVTNAAFYGRWSTETVSPAGHHLGLWVIAVPVVGGLIVGAMARWGSRAIRGHGIPEAMEQVLLNRVEDPAAHHLPQAFVVGGRDRHGWPVRRGRPDHRHRWRARLVPRPAAARHRRRAKGAACRRRRRRHGGGVRLAGVGGDPRSGTAVVRAAAALVDPGRDVGGGGGGRALRAGRQCTGVRHAARRRAGDRGAALLCRAGRVDRTGRASP